MSEDRTSRRRFLKVVAEGGAAIGATTIIGCSGTPVAVPSTVSAGNVSSVPVGTVQAVSGQALILGRDAKGLYAMSALCTHESCDMTRQGKISSTQIFCSCHGSYFDANGAPMSGPARSQLQHYGVTVDTAGAITIHGDTSVSADTRTAVAMG